MASSIDISFIVPIYNKGAYLAQCLDSLLAQSHENIEVLCVNNNSTDESPEIIAHYVAADKRVRALQQPLQGVSNARNLGIEHAQGTYLVFVDADDYVAPELAAEVIAAAEECAFDVLVFNYDRVFEGSGAVEKNSIRQFEKHALTAAELDWEILTVTTASSCTKAFNAEFMRTHNLRYDPALVSGEDMLMVFTALLHSTNIYQLNDRVLYHYRKDVPSSATEIRSETSDSVHILNALKRLDGMVADEGLNPAYHIAVLNQVLPEMRFAFTLFESVNQARDFYKAFQDDWLPELRKLDDAHVYEGHRLIYENFVLSEGLEEVLFKETVRLRASNNKAQKALSKAKKENKDLKRKNKKLRKQAQEQPQAGTFGEKLKGLFGGK